MSVSLSAALSTDPPLGRLLDAASAAIGALAEFAGQPRPGHQDEKAIDDMAHHLSIEILADSGVVAAIGSEEADDPVIVDRDAPWVIAIDPLDGSNNVNLNAPIGFIFAIAPNTGDPDAALLQPGTGLVAAGVAVLGPATTLLASAGDGTHLLGMRTHRSSPSETWDFIQANLTIPQTASIYAINGSNQRHWSDPYQMYHRDLLAGTDGPRGRNFNTRWLAALVAETQRILLDGGIYLYPGDRRPGYEHGRLRLVYEANPVAFLCANAGGAATNGTDDILSLVPKSLHQHTPLVFGSSDEVELVRHYLSQGRPEDSPLFGRRGLFRSRSA